MSWLFPECLVCQVNSSSSSQMHVLLSLNYLDRANCSAEKVHATSLILFCAPVFL